MNDNTILRIKVPAHLYESVKEQLTLTEAKNKPHYGAGMEVVKEKKMKTPKDGMKKMEEGPKEEVKEETIQEYVGLSPEEIKSLEWLAGAVASGTGAAVLSQYGKEIKDLASKAMSAIKGKKEENTVAEEKEAEYEAKEMEDEAKQPVAMHTPVKSVADLAKMMRKIALQLGLMKGIQPTEIRAIGELLQSILDKIQTGDITAASIKADRAFDTATQSIKPAQNEAKKKAKSEEEEGEE